MKKVSLSQLETILSNTIVKGATFATILQMTEPKALKKDRETKEPNPYGTIKKITKTSVILNSEYKKAVENQLKREDKDVSEYEAGKNKMVVVKCETNNFFGHYNGEAVLEFRLNPNSKPKSKFLADGKITDKSKLKNFLPIENYSRENQGTDKEIFWGKVYVKNIKKIAINKEVYKVVE